jgi:hypothetical protein
MEGPKGSRPATPEEPGSPYAKGRRVTDNHRDVELAADLLPGTEQGQKRRLGRDMAATPTEDGHEPGYGLGKTAGHGRVVMFRGRLERQAGAGAEPEETEDAEIAFSPDPTWAEMGEDLDWSPLFEEIALPPNWGEDATVVMVRNPRSLYVYWERAGYGDENLKATLGDAEYSRTIPCLRIYDVASGAWPGQPGGRVAAATAPCFIPTSSFPRVVAFTPTPPRTSFPSSSVALSAPITTGARPTFTATWRSSISAIRTRTFPTANVRTRRLSARSASA